MRGALVVGILLVAGCASLVPPAGDPALRADFGGIVVSSNALAAEAGAAMLRAGGSAADAAAAVQWALTVAEPQFSGIGGGSFILWRDGATGAFEFLDGREVGPAGTTADQFTLPGDIEPPYAHETRGYAVGVPGTVKVFAEAHARHGRLEWARTFEPAIGLARDGFVVDEDLARVATASEEKLRSWPASARLYLAGAMCPPDVLAVSAPTGCVGGAAVAPGATLANPALAATLELLAREGPDAFYRGPVAEAIALTAQQRLGRITTDDLARYEIVEREALRGSYRGHEIVTAAAPGGGPILLNMLGILEGFELPRDSVETLHLEIEAMKLAYADRAAYNADPDVVDVPQRGLVHPGYVAQRRALLDTDRASAYDAGDPWAFEDAPAPERAAAAQDAPGAHTSHFIVVDRDGNIVSSTTTIEAGFGTGMVVPGYGFLLNNELTDFDAKPGGPNEPGPFKRPRSSMVPTIVLRDGAPVLIVGAAGGPTITPSVMQVIVHVLDHGMGVRDAVAAARVFGPFDAVEWDRDLPADVRAGLEARGHELRKREGISRLQAAALVDGRWEGAPDVRNLAGGGLVVLSG